MVWIFCRGDEQIRIENRYDKQSDEFVLIVEHPDALTETKRFPDAHAFRAWLLVFARQLEARAWIPARPVTRRRDAAREVTATTTRRYPTGDRTFDMLLSRMVLKGTAFWMVERVMEVGCRGRFLTIPGMQAVTASTPDVTFARACNCIDKWLWTSRTD